MNLAEVMKQPDGFTPPDVTVTIEKVFAYKSGESEQGPWSFQDIQVTGGKLKLKGLPEFPSTRVGQTVTIKANQSKQHGLTGLKVAHEEYQNKIYDKLIITSSAKWDWGNNGQGTQPETTTQATSNGHSGNGIVDAYTGHILACATLANQVAGLVMIDDNAAVQACFATVVIDTKNRNILLPKPADVLALPEPKAEPQNHFGTGPEDDEDPEIPF
jgi:hypothetical protein